MTEETADYDPASIQISWQSRRNSTNVAGMLNDFFIYLFILNMIKYKQDNLFSMLTTCKFQIFGGANINN